MREWVPLCVNNAIATSIPPFELNGTGRREGEANTWMVSIQACIEFSLRWSEMIGGTPCIEKRIGSAKYLQELRTASTSTTTNNNNIIVPCSERCVLCTSGTARDHCHVQ